MLSLPPWSSQNARLANISLKPSKEVKDPRSVRTVRCRYINHIYSLRNEEQTTYLYEMYDEYFLFQQKASVTNARQECLRGRVFTVKLFLEFYNSGICAFSVQWGLRKDYK